MFFFSVPVFRVQGERKRRRTRWRGNGHNNIKDAEWKDPADPVSVLSRERVGGWTTSKKDKQMDPLEDPSRKIKRMMEKSRKRKKKKEKCKRQRK